MSFIIFDLIFLGIFCLVIGLFLYKHKKKLKVESKVFLLYRTKVGLKFINWFSKKFSKLLNVLSYFSITFGFFAMVIAFLLLYRSIELILSLVVVPKIPPIMPLVPYLPQIFELPLPPFYFTYWLLIIAIVAIVHEFSHGIFASLYKLKIKATGFGFLGPFLAAFVEPDEKAMQKRRPKQQLAILAAGSFSNFIFAIIFLLLMQLFFFLAYTPIGVGSYFYAYESVNLSSIQSIGNYSVDGFLNLSNQELKAITSDLELISDSNKSYYLNPEILGDFSANREAYIKLGVISAFLDSPAFKSNLSGGIQKIGEFEIKSPEDVSAALGNYKPNDTITVITSKGSYEITLGKNPTNESRGFLGVAFPRIDPSQKLLASISSPFFSPFTYVEPKINPDLLIFIRDLFYWLILISISIALINMLPLGMLDGGRFIYVAALGLTKSKKFAEFVFKAAAFLVLLILLILTVVWFVRVI